MYLLRQLPRLLADLKSLRELARAEAAEAGAAAGRGEAAAARGPRINQSPGISKTRLDMTRLLYMHEFLRAVSGL